MVLPCKLRVAKVANELARGLKEAKATLTVDKAVKAAKATKGPKAAMPSTNVRSPSMLAL